MANTSSFYCQNKQPFMSLLSCTFMWLRWAFPLRESRRWLFLLAPVGAWSCIPPHRHMMRAFKGGAVYRFMMGAKVWHTHIPPEGGVFECVCDVRTVTMNTSWICTPAWGLLPQPWGEGPQGKCYCCLQEGIWPVDILMNWSTFFCLQS